MSQFLKIEKALTQSVKALALNFPISYPNMELKDADKGDTWIGVSVLTASTNVATLGDKGEDNNPGVLQIDVNVAKSTGSGKQLEILDQIATAYPAGRPLQFQGQSVTVMSSSISPIRNVGGFAKRSISINYYARTVRRS